MGRLRRVFRLSTQKKILLFQATLLLTATRLGLHVLSFARLRSLLARYVGVGGAKHGALQHGALDPIVWAVEAVSRQIPAIGTCLTQALAAHVLLARRGVQSDLRIGVMRDGSGKFIAHAWLEKDGRILIGEAHRQGYNPMPVLNVLKP